MLGRTFFLLGSVSLHGSAASVFLSSVTFCEQGCPFSSVVYERNGSGMVISFLHFEVPSRVFLGLTLIVKTQIIFRV
jgi:hypothetical protein